MNCSVCKGTLTPTQINSQYNVLLCMNVRCIKYASPQGNVPIVPLYETPTLPVTPPPVRVRQYEKSDIKETSVDGRPICTKCGRPFDAGLKKDGKPIKEKHCWECSGWSEEYRQNRQVYDDHGKPVYTQWANGKSYL